MMKLIEEGRAVTTEMHRTVVQRDHAECTCGWRSPDVFWDPASLATWHRLAIGETIDNPYLRAFLAPITPDEIEALGPHGSAFSAARVRRYRLAAQYAWAIPTENVVRKIAELSPICDLGCGTGYWAKLLGDVGAGILAVDADPPLDGANHWHRREVVPAFAQARQPVEICHFVDVVRGDARSFDVPSDHALMLCWPPYASDMAAVALARYRGQNVIYIGEHGGCTGDDRFHEMLAAQWDEIAYYEIPQWDGLHDNVRVYARKRGGEEAMP